MLKFEWRSVYIVGPEKKLLMTAMDHFHNIHTTYISVSQKMNSVPQKLPIQILKGRCHLVRVGIKQTMVLTAFLFIRRWRNPPF